MRRFLLALALALTLAAAPAAAQDPYIVSLQDQVDRIRMLNTTHWLENIGDPNPGNGIAEGTRFVGSELARSGWIANALRDSLESFGWDVALEPFTIVQDTLGTVPCWNVIARRDGQNADALIMIGAHWDSINSHSTPTSWDDPQVPAPAANDNGSGVTSLLEIARILGDKPFRQDVELCLWGGEELWMLGSKHHVSVLMDAGMNIAGYFNLDMIGYDASSNPPAGWDMKLFYDPQSAWFKNYVVDWINLYGDVSVVTEVVGSSWANSDIFPFWQRHRPAVGFWEGDDHAPEYDNCCDTVVNNYGCNNCGSGLFLEEMCRIALACFSEWADVRQGTAVDPLPGDGLTLDAWPNPFRAGAGASLRFSLAGEQPLGQRLEIFDIGGRQLRSLALSGSEARWDGRDDNGAELPAGVYLARPTGLPAAAAQRIVLLR